ncbi:MAG: hypothetical protein IJZ91_07415 [Oscillospiraceae bacterium]|nr:hypothetical protein [Oscillospiraceae bacterium]
MARGLSKFFKICFAGLTVLFLGIGFVKSVFFPTDISMYEQRTLNKLPAANLGVFLDNSFQSDFDTALGDQISFSTYYKKLYNELTSFADKLFLPIRHGIMDRYVSYKGSQLYNGQLIAPMEPVKECERELHKAGEVINNKIALMPDVQFYFYYVNNDTDINFQTGEKSGKYEFFQEILNIPADNFACYPVDNFEQYRENFYYSDHHWNHKGSYKAYIQILELLGAKGEPIVPKGELSIPGILRGSKGRAIGSNTYYDKISIYEFEYPSIDVLFDGMPLPDYGDVAGVFSRNQPVVSYADIYGYDTGYMSLATNQPDRENILIVGDSYDNAILKLLANHFNQVHSVDTRCFFFMTSQQPILEEYVRENNISKLVFFGSGEFFKELSKVEEW